MYADLSADKLSWFSNNFMLDFARAAIAIENFGNETYDRFYAGFVDIFRDFLSSPDFNAADELSTTYDDFYATIKAHIRTDCKDADIASLQIKPASGTECGEMLLLLRELEER